MVKIERIEEVSHDRYGVYYTEDNEKIKYIVVNGTDWPQKISIDEINKNKDLFDKSLLEYLKKDVLSKLNTELVDKLRESGFISNGIEYQADREAQANLNAYLALIGLGVPCPYIWRDKNNINRQLTAKELSIIAIDMTTFVQSCYVRVWTAKEAVKSASTEEDIINAVEGLPL